MTDVKIEFRGLAELQRELENLSKKGLPYAMKETVDGMATLTQANWREVAGHVLVERNRLIPNSIQVERARVTSSSAVEARVGMSTKLAPFGGELEEGGTTTHPSGKNPIPGAYAGGAQPGQKRTHKVFPTRSLARLSVLPMVVGKSRKQTIAIQLHMAKAAGRKAVLLPRGQSGTGIYAITGGKRRTLLKLLYATGIRSVVSAPHPTLVPALQMLRPNQVETMMATALQRQVDRWTSWRK